VTDRLFTAAEVDALIPRLTEIMQVTTERHRQASDLAQWLREEQQRIRASGGALIDQRDWKARAERLDGLTIEVREHVAAIERLGGAVKDLTLGLVDFPGRLPGASGSPPVNLCWKLGEAAVRFWHGLDEGFAQRKPL
jgi:hypothetical protein